MLVSKKCQYALRAVFELAKRYGNGPVKIAKIAATQAIPTRFLENILAELKHAGYVDSRRGKSGGYLLPQPARHMTVGDIIRTIDGPPRFVNCSSDGRTGERCPLSGQCAFQSVWDRARDAMVSVYDSTTIQDIVDEEAHRAGTQALNFTI